MIRVERDPAFWLDVFAAPECANAVAGVTSDGLREVVASAMTMPLASAHGGFLFVRRDGFGRAYELHTLFKKEGWGREVLAAAKEAFGAMFVRADLVITYSDVSNYRTRPPLSFGFRPCGKVFDNEYGRWMTWALTADAWAQSPARLRAEACH